MKIAARKARQQRHKAVRNRFGERTRALGQQTTFFKKICWVTSTFLLCMGAGSRR
jgi:hypothetical protein